MIKVRQLLDGRFAAILTDINTGFPASYAFGKTASEAATTGWNWWGSQPTLFFL